jgi:PAS domain-containing protein
MEQRHAVLLVEDDEAHVRLVESAFLRHGNQFQITAVTSISAARQLIASETWDLVLADYLLGDGHGSDLIPDDAESADYGVVLLTSHGDEHVAVKALKSGAIDYVVKSPESFLSLPRLCERGIQNRQLVKQRREAEQALRRSEQHLRLALLASGSAAWDFDFDTDKLMWSREAVQLAELPTDTHDNAFEDYMQRVHPDDRPAVQSAWLSLTEIPVAFDDPVRVEHRVTLQDGSTRWIELCGRRIESGTGAAFQLAGLLTNITTSKRAEEELKLKEQELAHVARQAGSMTNTGMPFPQSGDIRI